MATQHSRRGAALEVGDAFVEFLAGERAKAGTWPEFYARTGVSENTLANWKARKVAWYSPFGARA